MKSRLAPVLSLAFVAVFAGVSSAQYHRPYYEERDLGSVPTCPYVLENRTAEPVVVDFKVGKDRWQVVMNSDKETTVMLPVGAKVSVRAKADVGKRDKRRKQQVYVQYFTRENSQGKTERGWMFYR